MRPSLNDTEVKSETGVNLRVLNIQSVPKNTDCNRDRNPPTYM
jgi:hypothetical protein